ncbi:hypothetical protein FHS29_004803 [Saccharothrix tamanrassetensis]|uniref:Phenylacetaldoxime dehydratase n=1 Tax=Saccharothrix tamanrassetensis TaxID=1051531 RepID=A0A841CQC2_9PSEU|nr:phenylacetaldoxime dehydratase family protein [Saccharothrix tamanrassetensis]MBB5958195.1 hypothetical protein [Saccharothrix tamanrassetensis]
MEARLPGTVSHLVVARIGVQHSDQEQAAAAVGRVLPLVLDGPHAPSRVERTRVRSVETGQAADEVLVCYWTDAAAHAHWWASEPVRQWWDSLPVDGPLGHWIEAVTAEAARTETMYSTLHPAGQAAALPVGWTDLHDYAGAARDRIPFAGPLGAGGEVRTDLPAGESPRGRRVRTTDVPQGACLIRTAQHWAGAPPEQLRAYLTTVEPTYHAAVRHLASAGEGCQSVQFLESLDIDGTPAHGSEAVLWWNDLDALLRWARDHPTHHAILDAFWSALVAPYGMELKLVLWHEVLVLLEDGLVAEYVNCRSGTGLLPGRDSE